MRAARRPPARAPSFDAHLTGLGLEPLRRGPVTTLQLNVGLRCDLACQHCHVGAGPRRSEALDRLGAERVLALLARHPQLACLDLTGGAPELNEQFRFLVAGARRLGRRVVDRCNLTVLDEPGQEDTERFLAEHEVEIVASLPCYGPENLERQRGRGVFDRSIAALQRLNALGYGQPEGMLALDLVHNPLGATLPPSQAELEAEYRRELGRRFGIRFRRLLTITNMPIQRFAHALARDGSLDAYHDLLVEHFNPNAVPHLMCRSLLSVSHDGTLHDCDFNQALGRGLDAGPRTIFEVEDLAVLEGAPIATGSHCFGCTAGAGSSCGGALA